MYIRETQEIYRNYEYIIITEINVLVSRFRIRLLVT